MGERILHILKGWLAPNHVTTGNKNDKILLLESAGNLTNEQFLARMKAKNTGIPPQVITAVVDLHNETVAELVADGYSVNTELFRAVPQFKGVIDKKWDPKTNSVYVNFTQGKVLREIIEQVDVDILGPMGAKMYLIEGEDIVTRATNGIATAGRNYILHGAMLKVVGDDPSVGITLTNQATGSIVQIPAEMIAENEPSKLIILLPVDLANGDYTLKVTTQYTHSSALLKEPRSVETTISIGKSIGTLPEQPSGGGGGNDGIYIDPNA